MIIENPEFLLLLPIALLAAKELFGTDGYGRKISAVRTALIVFLALAASSPAITQTNQLTQSQSVNVFLDNTTSTRVLQDPELPSNLQEKVVASGNSSKIFSLTADNLEENTYNLLVTDGQTEEPKSEIVDAAESKNVTVSIYKSESKEESSVKIEGPSTTVPDASNEYTVKISSASSDPVSTNVTLDEEVIFSGLVNSSYSFERSFDSEGQHTMKASISSQDVFQENNQYFKTVEVSEKPEILSIGSRGVLEDKLSEFYKVENRNSPPPDLNEYYAVLMKEKAEGSNLEDYLAEGNGLVYTGSFEESIPSYLPLEKSSSEEEEAGANVILLVDISKSTGSGEFKEVSESNQSKESIRVASALVETLGKNNQLGVVAYAESPRLVSQPASLALDRASIIDKISRIGPVREPTFHDLGIKGASEMTAENDTIVMLSDGKIGIYNRQNVAQKTRKRASELDSKLITVGMGEDPNQPFLEDLAKRADGYYLENSEAGRLNFRFGAGGGESEYTPIKVVNPQHFITRDLVLDSTTTGFQPVKTTSSADELVAGSDGQEFLSTWRYGLGRVAAFSAGQQNLERTIESDPELVSRTVSWAVGEPQRKRDEWTDIQDASRPKSPLVRSSYNHEELTRSSEDLYTFELSKPGLGLHKWRGETYAYNYHREKSDVGLNQDKLSEIAQETGGKIYDSENIDKISQNVPETDNTVENQVSLSPVFLVVALLLFLSEVGFRKLNGRL
jgi:hypothetical protein